MLPVSCASPSTKNDELQFEKPNNQNPLNPINVRLMSAEIWRSYYAQNKNTKAPPKNSNNTSDTLKHKRKRSINEEQQAPTLQKRSFSSSGICSSLLSRPSSSSNLGRTSVTSTISSTPNELRRSIEECGYIKLPTIPPLTVLVTPDGNVAPNTIATLPVAVPGPVRTSAIQSTNRLENAASGLLSPSSTASTVPTPIAVNYTPSKDAKLVCTSKSLSSTARSSIPPADPILQRNSVTANNSATESVVSANLMVGSPNRPALLNVPISQLNYPPQITATTAAATNSADQLTSKASPLLPTTLISGSFDTSGINGYSSGLVSDIHGLPNQALLQNTSAAAYLLQQQQEQQAQLFSNANICGLLGTSQLSHTRNILNNVTTTSSSSSNLLARPSTTSTFVTPAPSVLTSDILRQYQQQQQLNFNQFSSSPDLLNFYRLLIESSGLQGYHSQIKKLDSSAGYVSQNGAGITT